MYQKIGTICFWLCWPALYMILRNSTRTRIIVLYGDELLVTKTWLGDGRWSLPGGGLHHGEDPAAGAARELLEETGLRIPRHKLLSVERKKHGSHGIKYEAVFFVTKLHDKPPIAMQSFEISEYTWVRLPDTQLSDIGGASYGADVLEAMELLKLVDRPGPFNGSLAVPALDSSRAFWYNKQK